MHTRRLLLGMTQEKFGGALGVSFEQIQKNETVTDRFSASRLRQIATALGLPVTHFHEAAEGRPDAGIAPTSASEASRLAPAIGRIEPRPCANAS